jgi:hypothetical protein
VLAGIEAEPVADPMDRPLQVLVVEGDQGPTLIADQMVVVSAVRSMRALEASHAIADVYPADEVQAVEQLEGAVDARAANGPLLEFRLDLRHRQGTSVAGYDIDQCVSRGPAVVARTPDGLTRLI